MLRYTEDHEWINAVEDSAIVGITSYAAKQLGDVVFVEQPSEGDQFSPGDDMAVVESVKAASDVYAPISGEITEINEAIVDSPELVNEDAEGEGWFVKMKLTNPSELDSLMDSEAYQDFCKNL